MADKCRSEIEVTLFFHNLKILDMKPMVMPKPKPKGK